MADELNIPSHRWYQPRNNIKLAPEDTSQKYIYDSGIQKIDAWINSQPWGYLDPYIVNGFSPELTIDFIDDYYRTGGSASTFDDALNFTRASAATYTDADGVLQTAAAGVPRVGNHVYNGSAWVNEGLLHESAAATNLVTYSDFSGGISVVSGAVVQDYAISPDGEVSAVRLIDNSAGGANAVYVQIPSTTFTVATSTAYTFSIFAKADQLNWMRLIANDFTTPTNGAVWFDLANGVVGTEQTGLSGSIQDFGDGWYRCSITFTTDATDTTGRILVGAVASDGTFSVDLDGTSSILIYGAQFEASSVPTSHIPTAGATATRAAETLTVPIANVPYPDVVETTGIELITNGTFDTDTDWVKGAGWTIGGGVAAHSGSFGNIRPTVSLALDPNKVYQVTFDILTNAGGSIFFYWDNQGENQAFSGTGSKSHIFSPTILTTVEFGTAVVGIEIDNITVKEINPLAVSFAMEGFMTYADNGVSVGPNAGSGEMIPYRWVADPGSFISTALNTASTATGQMFFLQEIANVTDFVASSPTAYAPDMNVPFNIASRHGSTFINGAVDGTALTANTTPTALPDLSATDFDIAPDFMGNIGKLRVWAEDLGDTGIEEASA